MTLLSRPIVGITTRRAGSADDTGGFPDRTGMTCISASVELATDAVGGASVDTSRSPAAGGPAGRWGCGRASTPLGRYPVTLPVRSNRRPHPAERQRTGA